MWYRKECSSKPKSVNLQGNVNVKKQTGGSYLFNCYLQWENFNISFQRDEPHKIAEQFTKQYRMREDLTLALSHIISQKMGLKWAAWLLMCSALCLSSFRFFNNGFLYIIHFKFLVDIVMMLLSQWIAVLHHFWVHFTYYLFWRCFEFHHIPSCVH